MEQDNLPLLSQTPDVKRIPGKFAYLEIGENKTRDRRLIFPVGAAIAIISVLCALLTPLGCICSSALSNFGRFLWVDFFDNKFQYYPHVGASVNSSIVISNRTLRIVLLGDSLINRPYESFDLGEKMKAYLSQYDYVFEITNCGFDGHKIEDIRKSPLHNCSLPLNPHAVILFWGSDCSNVSEFKYSEDEISRLRETYVSNVNFVVNSSRNRGAFVALAGSGVLGEGAKLFAPNSGRFIKKEAMLNSYNSINQDIASALDIPFINVRKKFLEKVPFYQLCYKNCVTVDGVHENERGALIVAKLFSDVLSTWLTAPQR